MKTSELLRNAKELISTPDRWVQGVNRREYEGQSCYCMMGSIIAANKSPTFSIFDFGLLPIIFQKVLVGMLYHPDGSIVSYNDTTGRTHREVMQAMSLAIEEAERIEAEALQKIESIKQGLTETANKKKLNRKKK